MHSILSFISEKDSGVSTQEIQQEFKELSLQEIANELNRLHKESLVDVFKTKTGIFYRKNSESNMFTDGEEKIIFLLVKEAGSEGIWIKDIKTRSGLHQNLVTKILKTLEQRMIIKSVKSIKQNRKVYMLYDAVPAADLGDGPWFTQDAELDIGFVDALKTVIYEWLLSERPPTGLPLYESLQNTHEVYEFICRSGISSVALTVEDVKRILDILVHEKKILHLNNKYLAIRSS
ncbi:DNA-directed RNA polymerase III subunit RPC6 [Nematocida sp. AWRm80]|nr:DNA-directed RNA polymerase III subunit RPC6 [Nematocida sp. AWRm80]